MPTDRLTATFDATSILDALDRRRCPPRPSSTRSSARSRPHARRPRRRSACRTVVFTVAKRTLDNLLPRRRRRRAPVALPAARPRSPGAGSTSASRRTSRTTPSRRCCSSPSTATPPPTASTGRSSRGTPRREAARCRSCARTRPIGSTDDVDFETTKQSATTPTKSHLNRGRPGLGLGGEARRGRSRRCPRSSPTPRTRASNFKIPYTFEGRAANYVPGLPDPPARSAHGDDDLLTLVLEVTGEAQEGEAGQGRHRDATCGSRPSTTGAASAAGRSSRSPTRGTPRT